MGQNCLAEALGRYTDLSGAERDALASVETQERQYRRNKIVRAENMPGGEVLVVQRGWLYCSTVLEDGRRQIVRLHFRGDLLGTDTLAFPNATDAIVALTDADVTVIDKFALGRVWADHPRLAALFFLLAQVDRVMLTDRLVSIGRGSAQARVASLLLWLHNRLKVADPTIDGIFALPLTQEEIGDATGLTAVHVNRTIRALSERGLIARTPGNVRIVDGEQLARVAGFTARTERFDVSWLPKAR